MNSMSNIIKHAAGELGLTHIAIERRSKGYLLTARNRDGNDVCVSFACTPSDWRACRNAIGELRRQARGNFPKSMVLCGAILSGAAP